MPRDVPQVRILPMSDKVEGFVGLTIEQVQQKYFRQKLPKNGGRFGYLSAGLNAPPGTVVLFQFKARVIAIAIFERDERFDAPKNGIAGVLRFEPGSFKTFEPVNADGMREAWPAFRAFGHVKQHLNPMRYPLFSRRLRVIAT